MFVQSLHCLDCRFGSEGRFGHSNERQPRSLILVEMSDWLRCFKTPWKQFDSSQLAIAGLESLTLYLSRRRPIPKHSNVFFLVWRLNCWKFKRFTTFKAGFGVR